jgi:hypothetical protein
MQLHAQKRSELDGDDDEYGNLTDSEDEQANESIDVETAHRGWTTSPPSAPTRGAAS